jgi:hypothetical protein
MPAGVAAPRIGRTGRGSGGGEPGCGYRDPAGCGCRTSAGRGCHDPGELGPGRGGTAERSSHDAEGASDCPGGGPDGGRAAGRACGSGTGRPEDADALGGRSEGVPVAGIGRSAAAPGEGLGLRWVSGADGRTPPVPDGGAPGTRPAAPYGGCPTTGRDVGPAPGDDAGAEPDGCAVDVEKGAIGAEGIEASGGAGGAGGAGAPRGPVSGTASPSPSARPDPAPVCPPGGDACRSRSVPCPAATTRTLTGRTDHQQAQGGTWSPGWPDRADQKPS